MSKRKIKKLQAITWDEVVKNVRADEALLLQVAEAAARKAEPRVAAPPLVTRGESIKLVVDGDKVLEVIPRSGYGGDSAFVDWLNFTCSESTFDWSQDRQIVSDDQMMLECSAILEKIYGFGITAKRSNGANFYLRSYVLGDSFGMVCHGGQRNTVLITLSGKGCAAAVSGWEKRLHDFLTYKAVNPRITRCDAAYDDYSGEKYSVDRADSDYDEGFFACGGRTPECEQRGNWKAPSGKGRTFYVGHRTNGKFGRIYEKGKQLGDSSSSWVRCEVEFKSVDRFIPFDILLRTGEFISAAYPAFAWISERSERILTTQKETVISYNSMMEWLHRQCGAALWVCATMEGSADALLQKIAQVGKVPVRLVVPHHLNSPDFIHHRKAETVPLEMLLDVSFI